MSGIDLTISDCIDEVESTANALIGELRNIRSDTKTLGGSGSMKQRASGFQKDLQKGINELMDNKKELNRLIGVLRSGIKKSKKK